MSKSTETQVGKTGRFQELEGLRGIAAIAVVVYHLVLFFYPAALYGLGAPGINTTHNSWETFVYGTPITTVISGGYAVAIFFVLSGFVLTIGFFQTKNEQILRKLASKRYLRLMLPALASVLVAWVFIRLGLGATQQAAAITGSGWLAAQWTMTDPSFISAFLQGTLNTFLHGEAYYNPVLWTMQYEFAGSFLVILIAWLFHNHPKRYWLYGALCVVTFSSWYCAFVLGMVIADLWAAGYIREGMFKKTIFPWLLGLVSIIAGGFPASLVGTSFYSHLGLPFLTPLQEHAVYTTLASVTLILLVLTTPSVTAFLRTGFISMLGRYTYSLYLMHKLVIFTLTANLFISLAGLGYNKAVALSVLGSIPFIIAATILFERAVDAPAIRFSGKLYSKN